MKAPNKTLLACLTAALLTVLASGCASAASRPQFSAHIVAWLTPNYTPRRDDAIAIDLSPTASADDQALTARVGRELPRSGLHAVDHVESARWVLQATAIPLAQPILRSPAGAGNDGTLGEEQSLLLRLNLYSVTEFINGERVPIWSAAYLGAPERYQQHPQALVRLLLKTYGIAFNGNAQIDLAEADAAEVTETAAPAPGAVEPPVEPPPVAPAESTPLPYPPVEPVADTPAPSEAERPPQV